MGIPLGAYGPVRYTSSGMKMSLPWAATDDGPTAGAAATNIARAAIASVLTLMCSPPRVLVRERPEPQLLLGDLPQPRQALGLDDQKQDDQAPEDHQLDLLHQRHRQRQPDHVRDV